MEFIFGKSKKFDRDYARVMEILDKGTENLTHEDHMELLRIYKVAYHEDGKIEGITSFDSSCGHCEFCQKMIKASEGNPLMICRNCYDKKQEAYKINSANRHGLNLIIMSSVRFTREELATLATTELNRINSSGETPNKTYALNMLLIMFTHPFVRFAYWTKNHIAVIAAIREVGKPKNCIFIKSSVLIGIPDELPEFFDYVFTVYPTKELCEKAIADGAAECNGLKCKECGFKCYYGTHKGTHIAEVLRGVSKEKVQLILAELDKIIQKG